MEKVELDLLDESELYEPSTDAPTKKKEIVELLQRRGKNHTEMSNKLKNIPAPIPPPVLGPREIGFLITGAVCLFAAYGAGCAARDVFYVCKGLFSKELIE